MDDQVRAALAKWPNVPDVYGWLSLDARGQWLLRGEPIGHAPTRAFIHRNYARTPDGCWYFQNGPQRVFVDLEATPYIALLDGRGTHWVTHNGLPIDRIDNMLQDEHRGLILITSLGPVLVADRDLAVGTTLLGIETEPVHVTRAELAERFGFQAKPRPPHHEQAQACIGK